MKTPTFSDWPQESINQFTAILRQVIREELGAAAIPSCITHDAKFLASLPKAEYDRLMEAQNA